jgi:dipeptidyl aminopeptidase/acylaminoacyl peptidase
MNNSTLIPHKPKRLKISFVFILIAFLWFSASVLPGKANIDKKPMSLQDIMKFKTIKSPIISENGEWVVYTITPNRGDSETIVYNINSKKSFPIPRGTRPSITKDSKWVAVSVQPEAKVLEKLKVNKSKKSKPPKAGMALLNTQTGNIKEFKNIKSFSFTDDSNWLIYVPHPEDKKDKKDKKEQKKEKEGEKEKKAEAKKPAKSNVAEKKEESKKEKKPAVKKKNAPKSKTITLVMLHLSTGKEIRIEKVDKYSIDPGSRFIVYSISKPKSADDSKESAIKKASHAAGLFARDLKKADAPEKQIHTACEQTTFTNFTWSKTKSRLAFILHVDPKEEEHSEKSDKKDNKQAEVSKNKEKKRELFTSELFVWDGVKGSLKSAVSPKNTPNGWLIPKENRLKWTKDENRLFFGFKPVDEYLFTHPQKEKPKKQDNINREEKGNKAEKESKPKEPEIDLYDVERLRKKRGVDVWHVNDPFINPQQKKMWNRIKRRVYQSVYHFKEGRFVQLTDKNMPQFIQSENPTYVIGMNSLPYQRETTWDGRYQDVYIINLKTGSRKQFLTHYEDFVNLSYQGKYALFFKDKHWHLLDVAKGSTRNLTKDLKVPFYDEDHDYPATVPGYYSAGWTENDRAVLIYDKYDIWKFDTATGKAVCITGGEGRNNKLQFRTRRLDPESKFFKANENLLLSAFSEKLKYRTFYTANVGKTGVKALISEKDCLGKQFTFLKKAKKSDRILFTRESFEEFPDLWISDLSFKTRKKISDANPQKKNFLWGKSKIIEWNSLDGTPLQGACFLPENYDKNKRYPVLVYYYRFMSQRVHEFNQIIINHRPCFPYYTGHDYVVFLPDIRFDIGRPGYSATKCLVPGVQKLIDMGIADPGAIGLHGHSWSGYQTAFVITQTNMFAAAVAGAPVSNMTSAYSGIRWGSGMARQFQYEKSQSRIGKSLIEAPHLYIENSPIFFADRIQTPLLIEHGDIDGAVPWYQGIELYLIMRRLNKDCIFLQYNQEPHHLQKYPNKIDYTIKMKEYFDHYLKGEPAADWIKNGVPYQKK